MQFEVDIVQFEVDSMCTVNCVNVLTLTQIQAERKRVVFRKPDNPSYALHCIVKSRHLSKKRENPIQCVLSFTALHGQTQYSDKFCKAILQNTTVPKSTLRELICAPHMFRISPHNGRRFGYSVLNHTVFICTILLFAGSNILYYMVL